MIWTAVVILDLAAAQGFMSSLLLLIRRTEALVYETVAFLPVP